MDGSDMMVATIVMVVVSAAVEVAMVIKKTWQLSLMVVVPKAYGECAFLRFQQFYVCSLHFQQICVSWLSFNNCTCSHANRNFFVPAQAGTPCLSIRRGQAVRGCRGQVSTHSASTSA